MNYWLRKTKKNPETFFMESNLNIFIMEYLIYLNDTSIKILVRNFAKAEDNKMNDLYKIRKYSKFYSFTNFVGSYGKEPWDVFIRFKDGF